VTVRADMTVQEESLSFFSKNVTVF
jgi:hypothetical protein